MEATFGQCPKERRFFFWMASLTDNDLQTDLLTECNCLKSLKLSELAMVCAVSALVFLLLSNENFKTKIESDKKNHF